MIRRTMKRNVVAVLAVVTVIVLGGSAWFFTQGDADPTTEATAPPIDTSDTTAATTAAQTTDST